MFVCYVIVLYVHIGLRIAIKFDVSIYVPFTIFSTFEIDILRRKEQVFK